MIGALILTLCVLMLPAAAGRARANHVVGDFVDGQVIVELQPTDAKNGEKKIDKINSKYGTRLLTASEGSGDVYLLGLPAGTTDVKGMAAKIKTKEKGVLEAEPNYVMELPEGAARFRARGVGGTEPPPTEYAASALNLSAAHRISEGEGTTVAVLDTGVQADHTDLSGNVTPGYDFVDGGDPADTTNGRDDDNDGEVDEMFGHGTHVAGIVHLVAPEAEIMPLRVLNDDGTGSAFAIAAAVAYAESRGADVINLSLSTRSRSQVLAKVIKDATSDGALVAAAAGNDGSDARAFPAAENGDRAADGLVAVTSVGQQATKSDFANYGRWVDIAAPGENILSAYPVSTHAAWSGTSMSAPFVSGQAALIRAVYGSLDPADAEEKIRCSARSLDELNPEYAGMLGAGLADAGASLTSGSCPHKNRAGR
jgi:subtilisin family serine protease